MVNPDILFGRLGNRMFQMAYVYAQMKRHEVPDIFVQSPEYFEEFSEDIKRLYGEGIGMLPYVGIHLRVGKNPINPNEPAYRDNPFYTALHRTRYYADAFAEFPNMQFLIFSDDMEFARDYFQGDRFGYDDSKDEIEAFNKLASCQGIITANSSFSWWAAYLSGAQKIICPTESKWFADGEIRTRVPQHWKQIDFPYPQENKKAVENQN